MVSKTPSAALGSSSSRSVSRSVGRSVGRAVGQSVRWSVGRSVGRSVSQSVRQSDSQTVRQSVSQTDSQSVSLSLYWPSLETARSLLPIQQLPHASKVMYCNWPLISPPYWLADPIYPRIRPGSGSLFSGIIPMCECNFSRNKNVCTSHLCIPFLFLPASFLWNRKFILSKSQPKPYILTLIGQFLIWLISFDGPWWAF